MPFNKYYYILYIQIIRHTSQSEGPVASEIIAYKDEFINITLWSEFQLSLLSELPFYNIHQHLPTNQIKDSTVGQRKQINTIRMKVYLR